MRLLAVCFFLLLAPPAANAGWMIRADFQSRDPDLQAAIDLCVKQMFKLKPEFELFKDSKPLEIISLDLGSTSMMPELLLPGADIPGGRQEVWNDLPHIDLASMLKEEKPPYAVNIPYYTGGDLVPSTKESDSDWFPILLMFVGGGILLLLIVACNQR